LGDADTEKFDIHLELRTPEVPAPAPVPKVPPPAPVVKAPPPVPKAQVKLPPKPVAPPQSEFDDVEVLDSPEVIPEPASAVRTTKSGVPIVEAATDEEIAAFEARRTGQRRPNPPRKY
jgi:hypothetical protein